MSVFARSEHSLGIRCVRQIWTESELCSCGGNSNTSKVVWVHFLVKLYFLAKKGIKWRNYIYIYIGEILVSGMSWPT